MSLAHLLLEREVEFSFGIQFQEDPAKQKVDELTTEWDTPIYILSKVVIPKQVVKLQDEDTEGESLVFTPWNSQPDHAPVG